MLLSLQRCCRRIADALVVVLANAERFSLAAQNDNDGHEVILTAISS